MTKGKIATALALAAVVGLFGVSIVSAGSPSAPKQQMDTKPGPAHMTIDGKVNKIDGEVFVVQDYSGNEVRLYVGKDTKRLRGEKKVGDTIRAEVTRGGFANSIQ
jgi:hypothetical protein